MNKKQIEAYKYYHGLYPSALLLFHPGGGYVAMLDDARRAAEILGGQFCVVDDMLAIPDDDISLLSKLGDSTEFRIIDYRNDRGEHDFPDVERIKQEQEADY